MGTVCVVLMCAGKFNPQRRKPADARDVQELIYVCAQLNRCGFSVVSAREATDSESTELVAVSDEPNGRAGLDELVAALNGKVRYDGWAYLQSEDGMGTTLLGRAPTF